MPRQAHTVPIVPEVLEWARVTAGLTPARAAQALKVSVETVQAWESGESGFGITQLRRIAAAYKRPVAALLQPSAPELPALPDDFRTIGGDQPAFSTETLVAIRDAQRIQEIATELMEDEPDSFPEADLPLYRTDEHNPYAVGARERRAFDVDVREQFSWPSVNYAYNFWRARLQAAGIIVLAKQMPRDDCRGFSLSSVPVIVVSSREADQAKTFTLFHEYAHLTLRHGGVCLERDQIGIEQWCNRFAASFLVPAEALQEQIERDTPLINQVQRIAQRFKASRHVIALRLVEMGIADSGLYDQIKAEDAEQADWFKQVSDEEEFGGRPQDAIRLSEVGIGFAGIIFAALRSGRITPADASDMLDVRLEKLDPLSQRVEAARGRYRR